MFCTHLHSDHVGWNTMKVEGQWVPTFPNARYLMNRKEFDYWSALRSDRRLSPVFLDSIDKVATLDYDLDADTFKIQCDVPCRYEVKKN